MEEKLREFKPLGGSHLVTRTWQTLFDCKIPKVECRLRRSIWKRNKKNPGSCRDSQIRAIAS